MMLLIDDEVVKLVSNDYYIYGIFMWWGRNWGFWL